MARLMSFAMTEQAVRDQSKTVTRRLGWRFLRVGDELRGVRKVMGRRRGEPLVDLARVRVVSLRRERLDAITLEDVLAEGLPDMSVSEFVARFCQAQGCSPTDEVTRIEFEYVDEES